MIAILRITSCLLYFQLKQSKLVRSRSLGNSKWMSPTPDTHSGAWGGETTLCTTEKKGRRGGS